MFDKIISKLFSMKMAVLIMFLFGVLIGAATFIENDYGTQTARALIYKTKWFEFFLLYFILILIYNILRYKTYKTKFPVFLFHFSFVLIAIGALTTRYVGYEGIMHIREGQTVNTMVTDDKIFEVVAKDKEGHQASLEKIVYFSTMTPNHLSETLTVGDKKVHIDLEKYMPTAQTEVVDDPKGEPVLEFKVSAGSKGRLYYFQKGDIRDFGQFYIAYDVEKLPTDKPTFSVFGDPKDLKVNFPFIMKTLNMDTKNMGEAPSGTNELHRRTLYRFGGNAVVLKSVHSKAKLRTVSHDLKTKSGKPEYVKLKVSLGDKSKEIVLKPRKGVTGEIKHLDIDGVSIDLRMGAKEITLPFAIKLNDFELARYPGSMTPASYSSKVVLIDKEENLTMPYHIYMNHILNHRNYRLFQSSYDPDEKGTVLSVNHDPGTLITYIGYILLAIGMIWSLFHPKSRFQQLLRNVRKLQDAAIAVAIISLAALTPQQAEAATPVATPEQMKMMQAYDKDHAIQFGELAVQDQMGRMKPIDTVAHDVIHKVTGKSSVFGLEPMQVFLGMVVQPEVYQNVKMIKIGHPKIAKDLGLPKDAKYAAFTDFFNKSDGSYKIFDAVSKATRKKPLEQSKYDKELIKIDERVNVAYMTYQGSILRIYPKADDPNNKWYAPMDAIKSFDPKQAQEVKISMAAYFQMVSNGIESGNWKNADLALRGLQKIQDKYGAAVKPNEDRIKWEIWYNKLGLFSILFPYYLTLGLLMLIFAFIHVLKPTFPMKWVMRMMLTLFGIGFALHIIGMGIRWYIAGHAPWSNAYESIIFIAAATALAGLIFARRSPFALAGAMILTGITMLVAHMSFINPQITNLVPVLKSYWLMIHVATIISGDGFLGLGSILSFLVLVLYILRGKNGHPNIDRSIKELTNLAEMSIIVGLYLLTIGNFLGGVWANESWGRYWGWDSKETWAAVTILIYASVLHLRFIPKLRSNFVFNVAATWAYFSVLMTYFGVNYYLSGLHSYAAGDPVPIPTWVYVAVATLLVLTLLAARNRKLS